MTIRFACGHEQPFARMVKDAPVCQQCGERRVVKVDAPPPRFTVRSA